MTYLLRAIWSILTTVLAWLILNLAIMLIALFPNGGSDWLSYTVTALFYSSLAMLVGWLVVFLPLALFVPATSAFWRWPRCVATGAAVGAAIGGLLVTGPYLFLTRMTDLKVIACVLAIGAISGVISGVLAALTRRFVR